MESGLANLCLVSCLHHRSHASSTSPQRSAFESTGGISQSAGFYLEGNNDYTVGNNEPLANLRVGEKTDQEGDSVGLARLDLCFVCRQISAEFIPFFAANTKLYLDVRHSVGSAHMSVIPHWYAAAVQEVVFTTNEIDRPCLALFPNLKRAKLHTPEYRHLPLPRGTRRWTKADVEKENVIRKISSRAIKRFTAGRSATDKAVAGREFSLMVVIEFGDFIARFPGRDPKLVGTLVSSIDRNTVGTTNWSRKSRLRRALFMEGLVSTPRSRRSS